MKIYIKILVIFLLTHATISYSQEKQYKLLDQFGHPNNYKVTIPNSNCNFLFKIDSSTTLCEPFNMVPNQPGTNLTYLEGTKKVRFTTLVNRDSIQFYRYSIIVNDKDNLVSHAIPKHIEFIWPDRSNNPGMVTLNLGTYNIVDKKLTIEIYKVNESHKRITGILYNKSIQPEIHLTTSTFVSGSKEKPHPQNIQNKAVIKLKNETGIILSLRNSDLSFIYHVYLKELSSGKEIPFSNNWGYAYHAYDPRISFMSLDINYFKNGGDYELRVVPILSSGFGRKILNNKTAKINFTIKKVRTISNREIALLVFSVILISAIIILVIKVKSKRKLAKESRQKETAQLQLSAVRLHLNPHFIFNALAGIQNFINKNDSDSANRFMTRFARLTRNVLSNQELISIEDEKALLQDYLEMEKLRFSFNYEILIHPELDTVNLEIPAMLLQPLVENSVKHGISHLKAEGKIVILMEKDQKNLVITLEDNGAGFDTSKQSAGLGLSLTRKRISLLNSIYKESPLSMNIKSGMQGTSIKITLTNWL